MKKKINPKGRQSYVPSKEDNKLSHSNKRSAGDKVNLDVNIGVNLIIKTPNDLNDKYKLTTDIRANAIYQALIDKKVEPKSAEALIKVLTAMTPDLKLRADDSYLEQLYYSDTIFIAEQQKEVKESKMSKIEKDSLELAVVLYDLFKTEFIHNRDLICKWVINNIKDIESIYEIKGIQNKVKALSKFKDKLSKSEDKSVMNYYLNNSFYPGPLQINNDYLNYVKDKFIGLNNNRAINTQILYRTVELRAYSTIDSNAKLKLMTEMGLDELNDIHLFVFNKIVYNISLMYMLTVDNEGTACNYRSEAASLYDQSSVARGMNDYDGLPIWACEWVELSSLDYIDNDLKKDLGILEPTKYVDNFKQGRNNIDNDYLQVKENIQKYTDSDIKASLFNLLMVVLNYNKIEPSTLKKEQLDLYFETGLKHYKAVSSNKQLQGLLILKELALLIKASIKEIFDLDSSVIKTGWTKDLTKVKDDLNRRSQTSNYPFDNTYLREKIPVDVKMSKMGQTQQFEKKIKNTTEIEGLTELYGSLSTEHGALEFFNKLIEKYHSNEEFDNLDWLLWDTFQTVFTLLLQWERKQNPKQNNDWNVKDVNKYQVTAIFPKWRVIKAVPKVISLSFYEPNLALKSCYNTRTNTLMPGWSHDLSQAGISIHSMLSEEGEYRRKIITDKLKDYPNTEIRSKFIEYYESNLSNDKKGLEIINYDYDKFDTTVSLADGINWALARFVLHEKVEEAFLNAQITLDQWFNSVTLIKNQGLYITNSGVSSGTSDTSIGGSWINANDNISAVIDSVSDFSSYVIGYYNKRDSLIETVISKTSNFIDVRFWAVYKPVLLIHLINVLGDDLELLGPLNNKVQEMLDRKNKKRSLLKSNFHLPHNFDFLQRFYNRGSFIFLIIALHLIQYDFDMAQASESFAFFGELTDEQKTLKTDNLKFHKAKSFDELLVNFKQIFEILSSDLVEGKEQAKSDFDHMMAKFIKLNNIFKFSSFGWMIPYLIKSPFIDGRANLKVIYPERSKLQIPPITLIAQISRLGNAFSTNYQVTMTDRYKFYLRKTFEDVLGYSLPSREKIDLSKLVQDYVSMFKKYNIVESDVSYGARTAYMDAFKKYGIADVEFMDTFDGALESNVPSQFNGDFFEALLSNFIEAVYYN